MNERFDATLETGVAKVDAERRTVYGWAYLAKRPDGSQVVDHSGEFVPDPQNLEDVVVEYVVKSREGDAMHSMDPTSVLVESFVATAEKARAMGLSEGVLPEAAWWVGFKVLDDAVWKRVTAGELRMFSIHGKATRTEVP